MFGRDVVSGPANARGKFAIFTRKRSKSRDGIGIFTRALFGGERRERGDAGGVGRREVGGGSRAQKWDQETMDGGRKRRRRREGNRSAREGAIAKFGAGKSAGRDEFKSTGEEPTCRSAASDSDDGFSVHERISEREVAGTRTEFGE